MAGSEHTRDGRPVRKRMGDRERRQSDMNRKALNDDKALLDNPSFALAADVAVANSFATVLTNWRQKLRDKEATIARLTAKVERLEGENKELRDARMKAGR